jgi:hypothetical protein
VIVCSTPLPAAPAQDLLDTLGSTAGGPARENAAIVLSAVARSNTCPLTHALGAPAVLLRLAASQPRSSSTLEGPAYCQNVHMYMPLILILSQCETMPSGPLQAARSFWTSCWRGRRRGAAARRRWRRRWTCPSRCWSGGRRWRPRGSSTPPTRGPPTPTSRWRSRWPCHKQLHDQHGRCCCSVQMHQQPLYVPSQAGSYT